MGIGLSSSLQLKTNGNRRGPDNHHLWFFSFEKKSYGSYQTAVKELLLAGTIQLDIKNGSVFRGEYSPA